MKIDCLLCGNEINLDHDVFEEYAGPVKCFSCGGMMEIRTVQGVTDSVGLSAVATGRDSGLLVNE